MRNEWQKKKILLQDVIDKALEALSEMDPGSNTYSTVVENLEKLYRAKNAEKDWKISPNTVALIAANLIGIILVLNHEQTSIITSKALGFIIKGRV